MAENIRTIGELRAEFETATNTFLTAEMFDDHDIRDPKDFPNLNPAPPREVDLRTTFYLIDDSARILFLRRSGINIPKEWYKENDRVSPESWVRFDANHDYHAEIVSTTIFVERLKDIFSLIREGISEDALKNELEYHSRKMLEHRINTQGDREPDVIGVYRNRECRIKHYGIPCNPHAQVSLQEFEKIRDIVLESFKSTE